MKHITLFFALAISWTIFYPNVAYADDTRIEVGEYIEHLKRELVESTKTRDEDILSLLVGPVHIELFVVVEKDADGNINSYIVKENESIDKASTQKLSFDITIKAKEKIASVNSSGTVAQPINGQPAKEEEEKPWYKTFFRW